jgi:hypothetical protein
MAARARLYERVAHDPGPWGAVAYGQPPYPGAPEALSYPMTLERHVCGDRIVLNGYLHTPSPGIQAIDLWCRGTMMFSWPVSPPQDGPVRIALDLGIEDTELAA